MEFKSQGTDFEYFRFIVSAESGDHQKEEIRREEYAVSR
jgi:hypothetical protein